MSKSAKTTENEDGDENILFDDGFSVVDDINTGTGSTEGAQEKTNDDSKEDVKSKKSEDNDDKTVESEKQTDKEKENETGDKEISESKSEAPKSCSDAGTLILSNDVDLGTETAVADNVKVKVEKTEEPKEEESTKDTSQTEEKKSSDTKKTPLRKKGTSSSYVWITNVSNSVNASSLKKHFSDCGRVNTAKVVTNGKLFFGYVEFDTPKIALECVEKMNNTMLGGKKILVSRNRPDVTKKTTSTPKKPVRSEPPSSKRSEGDAKKTNVDDAKTESKKTEDKKESTDKPKSEDKKKSDDPKKTEEKSKSEDKSKTEDIDKKKKAESDKKSKSKEDPSNSEDLKSRMNETKKKLDTLRSDLDRTQIEVRNLRRRLVNEQKKSKAEELRAERYRVQLRKTSDELKEAKLEFKRDLHRVTKKHKLELDKAEFDRESFLKREQEVRRRQDDLNREFKKLEEAKKSFEHLKRSRKSSRSMSPPMKRFRGRDGPYPDVSPPPPPKLSGDLRKPLLERPPSSYYEEKKPRAIYERLGDYGDKPYSKDSNGRYRPSYPGESSSVPKSSWSQVPTDPWKKNLGQSSSANFMKPYLERFGSDGYQPQSSSSYYPPGTSDYPKHFDSSRKY